MPGSLASGRGGSAQSGDRGVVVGLLADLGDELGVQDRAVRVEHDDGAGEQAQTVAHDVAVHTAAMAPTYLSRDEVPAETVENERRIADETARAEGKPEGALQKIVEGRLTGFFKEIVLVDQAFAKDAKQTVGKVFETAGVKPVAFARFRVGA